MWLDNVDMYFMQTVIKINYSIWFQCIFTNWEWTDGRTDSHSDYSTDQRVVQLHINLKACVLEIILWESSTVKT